MRGAPVHLLSAARSTEKNGSRRYKWCNERVRGRNEVPDTGPDRRPLVERMATNLRWLRQGAGIERSELARRAGLKVEELSQFEGGAHELSATKALRLAHSVGISIDELVERIYWDPGETARRPGERQPFSERLAGFLQVLPANAPAFDSPSPRDPVGSRQETAATPLAKLTAAEPCGGALSPRPSPGTSIRAKRSARPWRRSARG